MSASFGMTCVAPLFVPGNRPDRFEKAAASGADALILDLEDAVAPAAKDAARDALRADFTALPVFVRINSVGSLWHLDDLAAAERLPIAGLILPKTEAIDDLDQIATGHAIVALIETARGLANARAIAGHPRVSRLAFGSIDYCADLGCAHAREALLWPRTELVLASRLASLSPPLDGVTALLDDLALTADDARHARELGFGGKLAIHPRQIEPIRAAFRPTADEIDWARAVLAAASSGQAVRVAGEMIDKPVMARARAILATIDPA